MTKADPHTAPSVSPPGLVMDATGVSLSLVAVTSTGGDSVTAGDTLRVPKPSLVGVLHATLQVGRLKFAEGMRVVAALVQELMAFQVKITTAAHDTYGAWREGQHDDLVLALALAAWWAERQRGATIEPGPNPFYDYDEDPYTRRPGAAAPPRWPR